MHTRIHARMYAHARTHAHMHACTHTHAHTHTCTHVLYLFTVKPLVFFTVIVQASKTHAFPSLCYHVPCQLSVHIVAPLPTFHFLITKIRNGIALFIRCSNVTPTPCPYYLHILLLYRYTHTHMRVCVVRIVELRVLDTNIVRYLNTLTRLCGVNGCKT